MKKALLIRDLLITPEVIKSWAIEDWDLAVQQGYAAGLLARMYSVLKENQFEDSIPHQAHWHLSSAYRLYQAHILDIEREIEQVTHTLSIGNIVPIFLKGAAYVLSKDDCHKGRLSADIDIFVDKQEISTAEQLLKWHGWQGEELDAHDEKYYREWMHEIPALTHITRGMTLDVHHNLIPITSRFLFDPKSLLTRARKSAFNEHLVLSNEDKILHSIVHLLLDGEFEKGFRDLGDINSLINHYSALDNNFWHVLMRRAEELNIGRLLYYCFIQLGDIYNTNIPSSVMNEASRFKPNKFTDLIINGCFSSVLIPNHDSCRSRWYSLASVFLFYRSHWLKMPLHILIPHLLYKGTITPFKNWKKNQSGNNLNG